MSDDYTVYAGVGGVVMAAIAAVVTFFKGFQTKGGCKIAHDAHNTEQNMYRELVDEKLSNIKEDVSEIKDIVLAQYGSHLKDERRTDRCSE